MLYLGPFTKIAKDNGLFTGRPALVFWARLRLSSHVAAVAGWIITQCGICAAEVAEKKMFIVTSSQYFVRFVRQLTVADNEPYPYITECGLRNAINEVRKAAHSVLQFIILKYAFRMQTDGRCCAWSRSAAVCIPELDVPRIAARHQIC